MFEGVGACTQEVALRCLRSLIPLFFIISLPALCQGVNPAHPTEIQAQKHVSPEDLRARAASVEIQRDANQLTDLCSSVAKDMEGVKQGTLSKDMIDRLRQLEKLSKRMREQLMRTGGR
jgi:hypothetical protein